MRVKVTISGVEESSNTMLMAVINGYMDVGVGHDRRKKTVPDNYVPLFDPNEMLQNKNVQVENEEDNEGNRHFLECANMAAFESNLNNASNRRNFKEEMLRNIQQRARNHVNNLVTDGTEVDEFEDNNLGNFSIE
eukprot:8427142-Ditylum_brightwellii.AAC.1